MMEHMKLQCLYNQKDGSIALLCKYFDKMEMQTNEAQYNMCKKKTQWKCIISMEYSLVEIDVFCGTMKMGNTTHDKQHFVYI